MTNSQSNLSVKPLRSSFYISLLVAFIDNMGVGLIYPLFAAMLFDNTLALLPPETTDEARGIWLGILIALMPLAQFFSSPIWGSLSDGKGRRPPLNLSICIGALGYVVAFLGILVSNIWLLLLSRAIVGLASGNISIVQAAVADLSTQEEKATNFGLYSMALGVGFALGPFFGGALASWGYAVPFLFAFLLMLLNLLFSVLFFKETHQPQSTEKKFNLYQGIENIKKVVLLNGIRTVLVCSFLHNFGWSYFFEFIPVYLISKFEFNSFSLGLFYGAAGCFYAVSTGLLIRPFVKRFQPDRLFFVGNILTAMGILLLPWLPISHYLWPMLFLICYSVAFVSPSSITLISNYAGGEKQGEALGVLGSVNSAALIFSPLFCGSIVGKKPSLSMLVGGAALMSAGLILAFLKGLFFKKREASTDLSIPS